MVVRGFQVHGGIPAEKRPALVERFRTDAGCRVFLSTDAGATGLNLQHASILINMDLPWNPALLEQRIVRIHRLGQKHPVQIVNFVAKGTIEEGMLSVLAFKRSFSAGILDGGVGEIALGGSRLTRFMKEVENVTGQMGQGEAMTSGEEAQAGALGEKSPLSGDDIAAGVAQGIVLDAPLPTAPTTPPMGDPWQALAQVGGQLMGAPAAQDPTAPEHPWLARDPQTGAGHLKIPLARAGNGASPGRRFCGPGGFLPGGKVIFPKGFSTEVMGMIERISPRVGLMAAIGFYQRHLSPYKGFCCAYRVHTGRASCSALGLRVVRRYGAVGGWRLLRRRLALCGVVHRRFSPPAPRPWRQQRGDCDIPCDVACDLPECWTENLADCCDCGGGSGDRGRGRKKGSEQEQYVHIPPGRHFGRKPG